MKIRWPLSCLWLFETLKKADHRESVPITQCTTKHDLDWHGSFEFQEFWHSSKAILMSFKWAFENGLKKIHPSEMRNPTTLQRKIRNCSGLNSDKWVGRCRWLAVESPRHSVCLKHFSPSKLWNIPYVVCVCRGVNGNIICYHFISISFSRMQTVDGSLVTIEHEIDTHLLTM